MSDYMTFIQSIKDAWQICINNEHVMRKVAHEHDSFSNAIKLVLAVGLVFGFLAGLFLSVMGGLMGKPFFATFGFVGALVFYPIIFLISSFIGYGILHILALLFGGKATFRQFYSVLAHTSILYIGAVIPFVGWAITIWQIILNVFILKNVHQLSTGRAIAVVLIPILAILLIVIITAVFFIATFGTFGAMSGFSGY